MIARLLYKLTAGRPARLIKQDRRPYLERFFLWEGRTFAYLHRFLSTRSEDCHNHPWRVSIAIVLCGGYREERMIALDAAHGPVVRSRWMFPGRINVIRASDFHRIAEVKPETWTLFIHTDWRFAWGFLKKDRGRWALFRASDGNNRRWWRKAPAGRDVGREPFGVTL